MRLVLFPKSKGLEVSPLPPPFPPPSPCHVLSLKTTPGKRMVIVRPSEVQPYQTHIRKT